MTAPLDTLLPIETPEGVDVALRPAGPVPRGVALGIDTMLQTALSAVFVPLLVLGEGGAGLMLVGFFLVQWFMPVAFEVLWEGQTPGKKAVGLRVVTEDGRPLGLGASAIRNLLRVADLLPGGYALGLVSMTLDTSFRRIGDLAAGTLVVHTAGEGAGGRLPEATPTPPPPGLRADEQRVLVDLARRSTHLGEARCAELARTLDPLVSDGQAVDIARVRGWTRWLVGAG